MNVRSAKGEGGCQGRPAMDELLGSETEPEDLASWKSLGIDDPGQIDQWLDVRYPDDPSLTEPQVAALWIHAGFPDPWEAKRWASVSLAPDEVALYLEADPQILPAWAASLKRDGVSGQAAVLFRQQMDEKFAKGKLWDVAGAYGRAGLGPQDLFVYRRESASPGSRNEVIGPKRLARFMEQTGLGSQNAGRCIRLNLDPRLVTVYVDELEAGSLTAEEVAERLGKGSDGWQSGPGALGEILGA